MRDNRKRGHTFPEHYAFFPTFRLVVCFLRRSEASGSLLVHLGARGDTIYCHEKELLGLDFAEEMLNVVEDFDEHFVLGDVLGDGNVGVVVCAVVDDAIHVEVETVEFGDAVFCYELRDCWIPLGHPAEEFGDTYKLLVCPFMICLRV